MRPRPRRRFFPARASFGRRLGSFGLLCLLGVGCARVEGPADFTIINGAEPETLDPALVSGVPDGRVAMALFEGLTRLDPVTATPRPGLAERWEIADGGRRYTFFLRTNAVWSTGEPILAEDVVYSWRRVVNPVTGADYAGQLYFVKNAEAINTGQLKDVSQLGARAIGERTVEVELVAPTAFFLSLCSFRTLAIVPRRAIERHGDRWILQRPLPTSGAYTLDYWHIQDRIRLRRNPRYWDDEHTRNEIVDLLPVDSANVAMNLYATRAADVIWDKHLIPTELVDTLRGRGDYLPFDYLCTYFVRFNVHKKPFDDVRVRQALALALDKSRLVHRITRGGEKPADTLIPPTVAGYQSPPGLSYNPEAARRLLAEAGYPGGRGFPSFEYLFNSSELHKQIAVELKDMWQRELGVTLELRQTEWKVYLNAQSKLDYQLSRSAWTADYNDANTFLDMFMSDNGNNRTGWKNARYDALVREANAQTNTVHRSELLRAAESILVHDEVPILPLYFYVGIHLLDTNRIDGVFLNSLDLHPMQAMRRRR